MRANRTRSYISESNGFSNEDFTFSPDRSVMSNSLNFNQPETESGPIKWTRITKIADQIWGNEHMDSYGYPRIIAVGAYIFIATSRGFILCYDSAQVLVFVFEASDSEITGTVTKLSASGNGYLLAAGYSKGYIIIWDVKRKVLKRMINPETYMAKYYFPEHDYRITTLLFSTSSELLSGNISVSLT